MSALRRSAVALSVAALALGSLSACGAGAPDPAPVADELVSAINSGDFSKVQFASSDAQAVAKAQETAFGPMGDIKHNSTVSSVAEDEEETDGVKTATADITTVWDVDETDKDLSYTTKAAWEYDKDAEQWKLRFDPSVLAPDLETGGYLKASYQAADRGSITAAGGKKIVTNRPVIRVGIDKTRTEKANWEKSAAQLAELVDIDEEQYAKTVLGCRRQGMGPGHRAAR
ncbi:NTF2-like N-terminal transpeptidase domain-containing protein [Glutamicibacter halophytocola]|uniref:NTF2-like N-terminal transpeptidase domain-containing protein n=1 Tax=Glutamicibacter halophytocola TaxID=1933880 RepID=UPI00321BADAE